MLSHYCDCIKLPLSPVKAPVKRSVMVAAISSQGGQPACCALRQPGKEGERPGGGKTSCVWMCGCVGGVSGGYRCPCGWGGVQVWVCVGVDFLC